MTILGGILIFQALCRYQRSSTIVSLYRVLRIKSGSAVRPVVRHMLVQIQGGIVYCCAPLQATPRMT